jgi:hypothetical protein
MGQVAKPIMLKSLDLGLWYRILVIVQGQPGQSYQDPISETKCTSNAKTKTKHQQNGWGCDLSGTVVS